VDSTVQSFMQTNNVSAGTVAVMRNGVVIYHRSFGWQNQQKTVPSRRTRSCASPASRSR
jgi:hypothetical protein